MTRKAIPRRMEKKIFQEANLCCPKCGESDVNALQIHHIQPYAEVKEHKEENLILLCGNCHLRVGKKEGYKENDFLRLKISLMQGNPPQIEKDKHANVINFNDSENSGVIVNADNLTINNPKKTVKILPPQESIASSLNHQNYIKYLIDRYSKFKEANAGKDKMIYPVIYASIKRKFGANWNMIALSNFERLADYLKDRIDKTILGRSNKAKDLGRYSTFEEHAKK